jgi:formylglycine-generating enzyme required for sulfatase activity
VATIITLQAIEQAMANLAYQNKNSLKYKLIHAIKGFFEDENALRTIEAIPSDTLIKVLWDTGNDQTLISKRNKNLGSIRSSINSDLKKLYDKGNNPEGVTINTANIFVMSEEAKDKALTSFLGKVPGDAATSLEEIAKIIQIVDKLLSSPETIQPGPGTNRLEKLTELTNSIRSLLKRVDLDEIDEDPDGVEIEDDDLPEDNLPDDDLEELEVLEEIDEDQDGAEIEDDDLPEDNLPDDDLEELEVLEEIDEDQDGAEIEDDDLPEDSLPDDDLEELEVLEKIDEDPDGVEIEDDDLPEDSLPDDDLEELEVLDEIDENPDGVEIEDDDLLEDSLPDDDLEELEVLEEIDEDPDGAEIEDDDLLDDSLPDDDLEELEVLDEIDEDDDLIENIDTDTHTKTNSEDLLPDDETGWLSEDAPEKVDNLNNAKFLAEEFNRSLAAMDRFYNQYILIPPDRYIVGSKQVGRNERPEKTIQLPSFYIGKYPIINALFEIFVDNTGYKTNAEKSGSGTVYYGRFQKNTDPQNGSEKRIWNATLASRSVKGACWYQPSGPGSTIHQKRNHPAVQVSLEDAMAFAAWTGKRLPTEDEWEAAARTAAGYEFPWGNGWREGTCNIEASCICDTTPVDTYLESGNDLGTIDTLGNVLEWTASEAPLSSKNHLFKYRIAKGGSWVSGNDISLSSRSQIEVESHSNLLGFRCVAF